MLEPEHEDGERGAQQDEENPEEDDVPLVPRGPQDHLPRDARAFGFRREAALPREDVRLKFLDALIPRGCLGGHGFHDDRREALGHAASGEMREHAVHAVGPRWRGITLPQRIDRLAEARGMRELPGDDLLDQLAKFLAGIRRAQREDRVEDRAEHVDVAARIDLVEIATRRLWRDVGRRADDEAVQRLKAAQVGRRHLRLRVAEMLVVHAARHFFREAPVHHEHFAVLADHHVVRLQVAMHDAHRVRVGDAVADLLEDREQRRERKSFDCILLAFADAAEHLLQRGALHVFHRVEDLAVFIEAELVHRDDVRVLELPGELRLVHEAQHVLARKLAGCLDDLHRDVAHDAEVARLVHHAHAAAADGAEHLVFFPLQNGAHRREAELGIPQRRGEHLGGLRLQPDKKSRIADLHLLVRPHARGELDPHALDEHAVCRTEILDGQLVALEIQPRVVPRDALGINADLAALIASDDVLTVAQREFGDVLIADVHHHLRFDFHLRLLHRGRFGWLRVAPHSVVVKCFAGRIFLMRPRGFITAPAQPARQAERPARLARPEPLAERPGFLEFRPARLGCHPPVAHRDPEAASEA